ncbi:MAG: tol-pal system-associated acyl-CoA thioesterase [Gammaproteobacteria bacterium]|nr:tol-pal system-associated acyl-CoA thioesterase [Gammaproteobacteria bacterium]
MKKEFVLPVRIYYEDTDAGGVVYYANYLRFMERARSEWFRAIGSPLDELAEQNYLFVVRKVEVDYLRPAKLGNLVEVVSQVVEHGKSKMILQQDVRLSTNPELVFCKGRVTMVCVNADLKPCRIAAGVLEGLTDGN